MANTVPAILSDADTYKELARRVAKSSGKTRQAFESLLQRLEQTFKRAYDRLKQEKSWEQLKQLEQDQAAIKRVRDAYLDALVGVKAVDVAEEKFRYSKPDNNANIENYTEAKYNKYGWARVNGVITAQENAAFKARLSDKKNGSKFPKTADGKYLFAVGNEFGVNNTVIVSNGNYINPSIDRVYRIAFNHETDIEIVRDLIYEAERIIGNRARQVVEAYLGEKFVREYRLDDCPSYFQLRSAGGSQNARGNGEASVRNRENEQNGGRNRQTGKGNHDVKFSLKDVSAADVETLRRENRTLTEALDAAKAQLKLTKGKRQIKPGAFAAYARKILKDIKSSYSVETLTENLSRLWDSMEAAAESPSPEAAVNVIEQQGIAMAKAALEKSRELDTTMSELYDDVRRYLRETPVKLTEIQRQEAAYQMDSYGMIV